jgi:hypothetical protein
MISLTNHKMLQLPTVVHPICVCISWHCDVIKLPEKRSRKTYPKVQNWVSHLQNQLFCKLIPWVSNKKTHTPRSTDQARQPPSGNGERGTASEVVGPDSKSASLSSIEVSRSSRSLCFSNDTITCDPDDSVITKLRIAARKYKNHHVLFSQMVQSRISDTISVRLCRNIMNLERKVDQLLVSRENIFLRGPKF